LKTYIPYYFSPKDLNHHPILSSKLVDMNGQEISGPFILKGNASPVANAGADQTVDVNTTVTLDGSTSTDPDNNIVSYQWQQTGGGSPVNLTNANTAVAQFTSPGTDGSVLTFELTVTDAGGLPSTDTCVITVDINANAHAPKANAGPDQTVDVNTTVTLDGSGSTDPDNDIVSYQWKQIGDPTVTLTNANTAVAQFTSPGTDGSVLTFELTVTDANGLPSTDTCVCSCVLSGCINFSDSFDSGASPLWGNNSNNWQAANGVYSTTSGGWSTSFLPCALTDFSFDVDINGVWDGGIFVRSAYNNGYYNGVSLITGGQGGGGRGLYWHIWHNGNPGSIINHSGSVFSPGANIHVKIKVTGNTYEAYLNGSSTPATTLTTSLFPTGQVALFNNKLGQSFDNVNVDVVPVPAGSITRF
jgi:hypothetical protein